MLMKWMGWPLGLGLFLNARIVCMSNIKIKYWTGIAAALLVVVVMNVNAQGEDFTYCKNSKGEVVIVTNWTCPKGYWPI
tara:strand:+ start:2619 stop:2855 length:237 start_codon:yes stop_codon:yes gene_type:complete